MAREKTSVQIDDCTYEITHLQARPARLVLRRVLAAAAPLAGMGTADIGSVLQEVMVAITDDDLDVVTACFAAETTVVTGQSGGAKLPLANVIEDHFTGPRLAHYTKWIKASMDHNFSGFFGDLRAHVAEAVQGQEVASQSPSTSTGSSTE